MPSSPPPRFAILKISPSIMHIKKQRLLTPGPTLSTPPLAGDDGVGHSPPHRGFPPVYKAVPPTSRGDGEPRTTLLLFASSGTGAMEASVSNLFSPAISHRVLSGEVRRRGGNHQAFGLEVNVPSSEYGEVVTPNV